MGTRGTVRCALVLMREIAGQSTRAVLHTGGISGADASVSRLQDNAAVVQGYKRIENLTQRHIPREQRLHHRHYSSVMEALRSGRIPDLLLNLLKITYEDASANVESVRNLLPGLSLLVDGATPAESNRSKFTNNASLLIALRDAQNFVFACGSTKIIPNQHCPEANTVVENGTILTERGDVERWYVVGHSLAAMNDSLAEAAVYAAPQQLEHCIRWIYERTGEYMYQQNNFSTAHTKVLSLMPIKSLIMVHFPTELRWETARGGPKGGGKTESGRGGDTDERTTARRPSTRGGDYDERTADRRRSPAVRVCYDYQTGDCRRNPCRFDHACEKCLQLGHGSNECGRRDEGPRGGGKTRSRSRSPPRRDEGRRGDGPRGRRN